ncbi:MAG: hypothetical protein RH917_19815 [Lacipirellulaceae bacterium]
MKNSVRYFTLLYLLLLTFSVAISADRCLAQGNPFEDSSDNPFGGPFDDPFSGETQAQKDYMRRQQEAEEKREREKDAKIAALRKEQDIAKLKAMLEESYEHINQLKREIHERHYELDRLQQEHDEVRVDGERMRETLGRDVEEMTNLFAEAQSIQRQLIKRLLSAKHPEATLATLNFLSRWGQVNRDANARPHPLDKETIRLLDALADSEDRQIRQLARDALVQHSPAVANRMGFQEAHGYWLPVTTSETKDIQVSNDSVRARLNSKILIDFIEIPLEDALEYIGDFCDVEIRLPEPLRKDPSHEDFDEQLLTYESDEGTARAALEELLGQLDLTYCIEGNSVKIISTDDPKTTVRLTYNIRGLLTDEIDMKKIEQLLIDQFTKEGKVEEKIEVREPGTVIQTIDKHRLVVTASESTQHEVSVLLGSLVR